MERLGTLMGCMVIVAVGLLLAPKGQAAESTWINHPGLKFSLVNELPPGVSRPTTMGGNGNVDCYFRQVITRPSIQRPLLPDQSEVTRLTCGVDTTYGFVGDVFLRAGTSVAGPFIQGTSYLLAGDNMRSGVLINSSGYLSVAQDLVTNLRTVKKSNGEVEHYVADPSKVSFLRNSSNGLVSVQTQTVSFSSNGKWMLADSPSHGLMRINTETGEVLSFGTPTVYGNGQLAGYQTAISADGRFAIAASNRFQSFYIYDLGSCLGQSGDYPWLKNCPRRNVQEQLLREVNYGTGAAQIRFTDHNQITFYAGKPVGALIQYKKYRLALGDVAQFGFGYLGLGDSFASGEGSGAYKTITDQESNMCHTSTISYPFLLGRELNEERYESVACSGAKMGDLYLANTELYKGQFDDGKTQSQRNIEPLVDGFLPGKITQETFVSELDPKLITVSIGGNDIGFADKIKSCALGFLPDTTCFNTYEDRVEVAREILDQVPKLEQTYRKLSENNRKVYVLGYPKLIAPDGDCADNVPINNSEADFIDKLVVLLNDAVETAAKRAGVQYVDVEEMLVGHRFCETVSSDVYVHGLTFGDETGPFGTKILSKGSFHPKSRAQPLYAEALMNQTDRLSRKMPQADTNAKFNLPPASDPFWQVERTNRSTFIPHLIEATGPVGRGVSYAIQLKEEASGWLKPNSNVRAELHSNPVSLGTFTVDSQGNLTANVTIPENVPAGYHSLHFYGENVAGEPVDLYQYLYVYASETDFDGDGALNQSDPCTFVEPINEDIDEDGIDDGCDSDVGPPPPPTPEPEIVPEPEPEPEPTPNPIGLPTDVPADLPEDNKEGLKESVAGNEELIPQPAETVEQASSNVATNISTDIPRRALRVIASAAAVADPEVLGAQAPEVTTPDNTAESNPVVASGMQKPTLPKEGTKLWWILGVGFVFVILPATFAYARQRSE